MKFVFTFSLFIFLFSCGTPYDENNKRSGSVNDSVPVKNNISVDVKDSLNTVYREQYGSGYRKVYKGNMLVESQFLVNQTDTLFYDNGKPKEIREGPSFDFNCKYYEYYRNGRLKSVSQQGVACAMGIQVGEELDYDSLGNLLDRISFDNICDTIFNSGHNTQSIITTIEYYPGEKIKSKKQIITGYESLEECDCGTWEYYDRKGNLVKKENHGKCSDSTLNCHEIK